MANNIPVERERKFRVPYSEFQKGTQRGSLYRIEDLYIEASNIPPLRVRHTTDQENITTCVVAVKIPRTDDDWDELQWSVITVLGRGPRLRKQRVEWLEDGLLFHVETLELAGSPCIAEVEFPSTEAKLAFVPPPNWVEVTGDKRFSNFSIAKNGFPA